jgi:hypothetical protein
VYNIPKMTEDTIVSFYEKNKEKLITLYRSSIATWDHYIDDFTREMPPLCIARIKIADEPDILVLVVEQVACDIILGYPIAQYDNLDLFDTYPTKFNGRVKYHCNKCNIRIYDACYHCGSCDYDLCDACKEHVSQHIHPMFENKEYFGMNTYDKTDIITEYRPSNVKFCDYL